MELDKEQLHQLEKLGLEDIVVITNRIGLDYADAKKKSDRFELMKPIIRARVMHRLDQGRISETKLRRLTEIDEEYVTFIEQLVESKAECERLRIRYESYRNLFDARRSLLSYKKAEMKLI